MVWGNANARAIYRRNLKEKGFSDAQLEKMSLDEMKEALKKASSGSRNTENQPVLKPPPSPATKFVPSKSRVLLPDSAKGLGETAEEQAALKEVFEDGFKAFEKEAAEDGLTNDVAGAMAFLIGCAYTAYHHETPDEDGLAMLALALQHQVNTDAMRKISALDKQKFYELNVCLGVYLLALIEIAVQENDEKILQVAKDAAKEALVGYLKFDPDKYRISKNGIEILE